jgi:hypothetical protein
MGEKENSSGVRSEEEAEDEAEDENDGDVDAAADDEEEDDDADAMIVSAEEAEEAWTRRKNDGITVNSLPYTQHAEETMFTKNQPVFFTNAARGFQFAQLLGRKLDADVNKTKRNSK